MHCLCTIALRIHTKKVALKKKMKMKRRNFIFTSTVFGVSACLSAQTTPRQPKVDIKIKGTIAAVQEHLFPAGSKIPSAKEMNAIQFLVKTIMHKSYDRDIRGFVMEGALELEKQESGKFTLLSKEKKEDALREYEESNYGSNWLSRIMTLTMEALFSDPVYGSNIKEAGWKSLGAYGGLPRPKTRYIYDKV